MLNYIHIIFITIIIVIIVIIVFYHCFTNILYVLFGQCILCQLIVFLSLSEWAISSGSM